jgi:hypothetical protein
VLLLWSSLLRLYGRGAQSAGAGRSIVPVTTLEMWKGRADGHIGGN